MVGFSFVYKGTHYVYFLCRIYGVSYIYWRVEYEESNKMIICIDYNTFGILTMYQYNIRIWCWTYETCFDWNEI